jgi:AraC-like DNA-binding protein
MQQRTVTLLARLAPLDGYNLTPLHDVRLLRSNWPLARTPVLYDPGIVIVIQGRKRGYLGDTLYLYDAQHYLAVSVPMPFTMETDASVSEPLLAIYLHLDFTALAAVMLELDALHPSVPAAPASMVSTRLDAPLAASVLRLLETLAAPLDCAMLGPALIREIYYRVLCGEQGATLRAALALQGNFGRIARAIRQIHSDYARPLDVASLADTASMSAATFHLHFKQVTSMSPMQYLKSLRLHQARLMMARNGLPASVASAAVGYESASQFGREFKRQFGLTPMEEMARMQNSFALPPPREGNIYVSSH